MKKEMIKKVNNGVIVGASVGIYWLIIVAIYGLTSLLTTAWNITWIIWPIAFVVFMLSIFVYFNVKNGNLIKKHSSTFIILGTVLLFVATYLLVSLLVKPSIWHLSWLIYIGMVIAILVEVMVFAIKKNKILQAAETEKASN